MPLKTYFNLPREQQREILDISYTEFVRNSYENASLNNIIKEIGIAKGSFYRYFVDKFDLYKFLIDNLNQNNLNNFKTLTDSNNQNIYKVVKEYLLMVYDFDQEEPKYSAFLYMVNRNRSTPALDRLVLDYGSKTKDLFTELLRNFYSENRIVRTENIEFLAYNLQHFLNGIIDYISLKYKIDFNENARKGLPLFRIKRSDFEKEADMYIKLIKSIIKGE